MGGSARVPGPARTLIIEWRARRIADPIWRLRYLRGTAASSGHRRLRPRTTVVSVAVLMLFPFDTVRNERLAPHREIMAASRTNAAVPPLVWLVEQAPDHESYSNGLRIDNRFSIGARRRMYAVFERNRPDLNAVQWRSEPAGIVYHATESDLPPLDPEEINGLRRTRDDLLEYVRRRHSYHFLIDRFGSVFRVVAENDAANHAGYSIWADRQWLYLNLNAAFLGIAFEAHTGGGEARLEPAQAHAGRVLTDMLRSRYSLPATNCITHAQVSVNPHNMRIGYHIDWATDFPFPSMGLGDNYGLPVAAVALCGLGYDSAFLQAAGGHAWKGLDLADEIVREEAAAEGLPAAAYALALQRRYRAKLEALRQQSALEEPSYEQ